MISGVPTQAGVDVDSVPQRFDRPRTIQVAN